MQLQAPLLLSWDFTTFFKGTLTLAEGDESITRPIFPAVLEIKTHSHPSSSSFFYDASEESQLNVKINSAVCVYLCYRWWIKFLVAQYTKRV